MYPILHRGLTQAQAILQRLSQQLQMDLDVEKFKGERSK